jgi:drug/metabolite transporter (DMT)-like permease
MRTFALTAIALVAFAGNSVLCRLALTRTTIDAASFTSIRMLAGAAMLALVSMSRRDASRTLGGSWRSAAALFIYAAGFSLAYVHLTTGTGALLLFGAVQASMITYGMVRGERFSPVQYAGLALAYAGLIGLVLPGLSAPPLGAAALMISAGGRVAADPISETAGNFLRVIPMTLALSAAMWSMRSLDVPGAMYAIASGAITSGLGYVIWYTALRQLRATTAATVQLSVPVLAAIVGIVVLHESTAPRLLYASVAILGGIALVLLRAPTADPAQRQ